MQPDRSALILCPHLLRPSVPQSNHTKNFFGVNVACFPLQAVIWINVNHSPRPKCHSQPVLGEFFFDPVLYASPIIRPRTPSLSGFPMVGRFPCIFDTKCQKKFQNVFKSTPTLPSLSRANSHIWGSAIGFYCHAVIHFVLPAKTVLFCQNHPFFF